MADKQDVMDLNGWYEKQFLPWKEAVRQYFGEKDERLKRLHQHVGQLQTVVALLMDGKSRQALMAWNTLQLHPHLADIGLSSEGEMIVLTEPSGKVSHLRVEDVLAELEALLREREIT